MYIIKLTPFCVQLENGDAITIERVENEMPRRVKKRRQIQTEEGIDAGWEEYYDYIFPSDQGILQFFSKIYYSIYDYSK